MIDPLVAMIKQLHHERRKQRQIFEISMSGFVEKWQECKMLMKYKDCGLIIGPALRRVATINAIFLVTRINSVGHFVEM